MFGVCDFLSSLILQDLILYHFPSDKKTISSTSHNTKCLRWILYFYLSQMFLVCPLVWRMVYLIKIKKKKKRFFFFFFQQLKYALPFSADLFFLSGIWLVSCYYSLCIISLFRSYSLKTFFFFLHHVASGFRILVPWPGTELRPLVMKAACPNHWTTRESVTFFLILRFQQIGYAVPRYSFHDVHLGCSLISVNHTHTNIT